ncbi:pilus assembly protein TadG-related protein [Aeromicrobium terrae]|uniref:Putative Flp pilus-assembly TadG-like N-terminal domain-containing protein n=1 Tax=Aeromicrobium terrae TaxID=2498846 RepID=A0A5C8NJG3_9ACTN|nr:pilus assembly protein TadG-related protein [Aeromicrobium terrae]TXL62004.1 hypothetical protein FHP06_04635 [Aeromicrobium terrae]
MKLRPTQQGDRGAAAVSLLTVGIIISLAIIAVMAIPLTQASDAKAKSRSAADAAALAGADHVRLELKEQLSLKGWLGGWGNLPIFDGGLAAARTYAERNDATLVAYQRPSFDNGFTAYARVEGRTVKGEVTRSEAWAKLSLPDCQKKDDPEPTEPPPDDDEDDDDEDEPPPPQGWECAGIEFDVPVEGPPHLSVDIIDALFNDSNAKLVD